MDIDWSEVGVVDGDGDGGRGLSQLPLLERVVPREDSVKQVSETGNKASGRMR